MLHVNLGARTPQSGWAPAIGRAERGIIARCLSDLEMACRVEPESASPASNAAVEDRAVAPAPNAAVFFAKLLTILCN